MIFRQSGMGPGICGIASGPPSYPYGNKTEEAEFTEYQEVSFERNLPSEEEEEEGHEEES